MAATFFRLRSGLCFQASVTYRKQADFLGFGISVSKFELADTQKNWRGGFAYPAPRNIFYVLRM